MKRKVLNIIKHINTTKGRIILGSVMGIIIIGGGFTAYAINASKAREEPKSEQIQDEEVADTSKAEEPSKQEEPAKQEIKEEMPKTEVAGDSKKQVASDNNNKKNLNSSNKPKEAPKPRGPITYKSTGLHIAFDMPRSWEDNYVIKDNGKEIRVYMKHEQNDIGAGYLFTITSDIHDYNNGMDLDSIGGEKKKNINGKQYLVGGPLDFRMDDNDPRVKTYKSMVRECSGVLKTLRAA